MNSELSQRSRNETLLRGGFGHATLLAPPVARQNTPRSKCISLLSHLYVSDVSNQLPLLLDLAFNTHAGGLTIHLVIPEANRHWVWHPLPCQMLVRFVFFPNDFRGDMIPAQVRLRFLPETDVLLHTNCAFFLGGKHTCCIGLVGAGAKSKGLAHFWQWCHQES